MANSAVMATDDSFNAEFNFTWKIKNFSYCFPWTWVRSPTFTIESMDKTRWCLQLWPKEYTNGIHMEFYLAREEVDGGPEFMRVAFELSFLDPYGIQLVKKSREATFSKNKNKGFGEFVEQAVVYTHRRYEYLSDDTLTACCRMRRIGERLQKPVFWTATSVIGVEQSSFDWNIENFSKIRPGLKRIFRKKNPFIKVELSLTAKPEEALKFEISHAHMDEPNMTDCEISVLNASRNTVYSERDSRYLEGQVWEFPTFLKKSQLTAEKRVCLSKDRLALKFDISVSLGVISSVIESYESLSSSSSSVEDRESDLMEGGIVYPSTGNETISSAKKFIVDLEKDVQKLVIVEGINTKEIPQDSSTQDEETSSSENESSPTQSEASSSSVYGSYSLTPSEESSKNGDETVTGIHKLYNKSSSMEEIVSTSSTKDQLYRFYRDGTFSDVNLTVGNETFPAHKLILSLRSFKFKEIFMKNLSKNSIKLEDLDPETLRDLLDYIYTNEVRNLTFGRAQKLFLASESYQMWSLKHVCLMFMKENINESNACSVLILADEQRDQEMKQIALQFIVRHGRAIMNTKAWDELTAKHIKLAFETMQQMYLNQT